jgi:hypothetical protein
MFANTPVLFSLLKVETYYVPTHVLRRTSVLVRIGSLQVSVLTEESRDYKHTSYFLCDGWLKYRSSLYWISCEVGIIFILDRQWTESKFPQKVRLRFNQNTRSCLWDNGTDIADASCRGFCEILKRSDDCALHSGLLRLSSLTSCSFRILDDG